MSSKLRVAKKKTLRPELSQSQVEGAHCQILYQCDGNHHRPKNYLGHEFRVTDTDSGGLENCFPLQIQIPKF